MVPLDYEQTRITDQLKSGLSDWKNMLKHVYMTVTRMKCMEFKWMNEQMNLWRSKHTWLQNSINELLAGDSSVVITILLAEEVHNTWFVVVHPSHVSLTPLIEVKVLHTFNLKKINLNCNKTSIPYQQFKLVLQFSEKSLEPVFQVILQRIDNHFWTLIKKRESIEQFLPNIIKKIVGTCLLTYEVVFKSIA